MRLLVLCLIAFASIFARTFREYRTPGSLSSFKPVYYSGSRSRRRAAQNIKDRPAQSACATKARERIYLSGHAMACSLRDSLQGSGTRRSPPHLTLRTSFPLPSSGRPCILPATGRLHCLHATYCNFSRLAQAALVCNYNRQSFSRLRLVENSNGWAKRQPRRPCEKRRPSVGKALHAARLEDLALQRLRLQFQPRGRLGIDLVDELHHLCAIDRIDFDLQSICQS
jgi:hypothetical protein